MLSLAIALLLVALGTGADAVDRSAPFAGRTFGEWVDTIQPRAEEMKWLEVPWLPTFAEGIQASHDQQKPLLLWVMNGHPLGCT